VVRPVVEEVNRIFVVWVVLQQLHVRLGQLVAPSMMVVVKSLVVVQQFVRLLRHVVEELYRMCAVVHQV